MPVDFLQVQPSSKILPAQPKSTTPKPTAAEQQAVNTMAMAKLKQKNRKAKTFEIEVPGPLLAAEAGTAYNLEGFSPDADRKWILQQVEFRFRGGEGGSTTRLSFMLPQSQIKTGTAKSS
jgi:hypothetical protein